MQFNNLFLGITILFLSLSLSGYHSATAAMTSSLAISHHLTSFGSGPSLSPDGKELVFVNYSTYGPPGHPTEIWAIGIDGNNPRLLTTTQENIQASDVKFSPDGNKIAFIGKRQDDGNRSLFVMEHDGSNVKMLPINGVGKINTFAWLSDEKIVYAQQESENSVEFRQLLLGSSGTDASTSLKRVTMDNATRFVVSGNIVLYNDDDGASLLFTGFGAGQGKSDIFSLNLQTGELKKMNSWEDNYVIGLGSDGRTVFIGQTGGENSASLYSTDLENTSQKTLLLDGNFDYSIHGNTSGNELVVAYAFAPGGVSSSDADQWSNFGIYVACQDDCGSKSSSVFSNDYIISNGQYIKGSQNDIMMMVMVTVPGIVIAAGAGVVVYMKKLRRKNLAP